MHTIGYHHKIHARLSSSSLSLYSGIFLLQQGSHLDSFRTFRFSRPNRSRLTPIKAEYIFLVVSVFYVAAPVSLAASLLAHIDYSGNGCAHACGREEATALAPLAAASLHLVSFVLRFRAILGVVRAL
eukprot:Phypoly_transcript_17335.p1 GENE.Phypoly_transcript_17335~~Phypoly_transcript_17335.p1  ORF type:complete len:128 (+),score=8.53 Phypoly_transcript_17335:383-766(+)